MNDRIDKDQALKHVHEFLCQNSEIVHLPIPPPGVPFYNFNPECEHLFTFTPFGFSGVGGSPYVSVNKKSGEVRYLGMLGE